VTAPDLLDTSAAGPAAIRGGVLRIGAYLVGTVAAVGSFALLTRHLGVATVGRYSVALALLTIVGAFSDLGMSSIGVRELSTRRGDDRDAFARNLLGLRLVMTAVGGLGIIAFAAVAGYGTTLTEGVALGSVGLLLQAWQTTLAVSLLSELRLGWVAAFELLRSLLNALVIILLVLAGARLLPFLAVTIPVGATVLVLNAWLVRGRAPLTPLFNGARWRSLFAAAVPYAIAAAAAAIYFQLALIIVSLLANKDAVGYFGVSSRVIQVLLAIPGLAVGAAFPIFARAARDDRARLAYALGRVFEVSLLLGVFVSVLVGVGAPLAIRIVGGGGFEQAAHLLAIQGVGLGASFVAAVWSFGLLSLGRTKDIMVIHLTVLIVGGTGVAILVSADGAQGAAIGTAVGEVVLALLTGAALTRADRRLTPPLRVVPAVAVAAGLASLTLLAGLPTLAACAVAGLVYLVAAFVLGAVPKELRELLPARRSP
jgi:O-antigen/teichoic acid export membrane protein